MLFICFSSWRTKCVEKILENMKAEINRDMKLMGCKNVRELNRSKLIHRK